MQALLLNFRHQGKKAIEKVARNQPTVYLRILASLVPRGTKVEHTGGAKSMTDEQLEAGIEAIQAMLEQRAGEAAKVIEGTAEPIALPAPRQTKRKVRRTPEVEPSEQYAQSSARPPGGPASDIDTAPVDGSESA